MKALNESELDTIIGGVALPSFFDSFRRESDGKIMLAKGTMQGGKFVQMPNSITSTVNRLGDCVEGLTRLLSSQKRSGCTHVALGEAGEVFAIDDLLEKLA